MTREEAIATGMETHETQHSMMRRTPWHDYSRKGTYMLTLVVRERTALFGQLKGDLKGDVAPYIELSTLGTAIKQEEIQKIHQFYPEVEVWKLCIMPDHLHMIVRVNENLGKGKHLGMVVAGFKGGCSKAAMRLGATIPCAPVQDEYQSERSGNGGNARCHCTQSVRCHCSQSACSHCSQSACSHCSQSACSHCSQSVRSGDKRNTVTPLFEEGYCDKILMHEGQLDNWKHYLDDNPRRLMIKRQNPKLFTVQTGMEVAGEQCQVVGNRFLLDIPDKMTVIVHRRYTDDENAQLKNDWLTCGERGGVLVSAAISPKEKEVLREAMSRGYNIILLRENGFPKLYKPVGEAFDACASGVLLQISPWEFHMEKKQITREQCLHLNAMAERIADNG